MLGRSTDRPFFMQRMNRHPEDSASLALLPHLQVRDAVFGHSIVVEPIGGADDGSEHVASAQLAEAFLKLRRSQTELAGKLSGRCRESGSAISRSL